MFVAIIGADLLSEPFRGLDSNQNTDINAGGYHVVDSYSPAGRVVSCLRLQGAGSGFDPQELEIYSFCLS